MEAEPCSDPDVRPLRGVHAQCGASVDDHAKHTAEASSRLGEDASPTTKTSSTAVSVTLKTFESIGEVATLIEASTENGTQQAADEPPMLQEQSERASLDSAITHPMILSLNLMFSIPAGNVVPSRGAVRDMSATTTMRHPNKQRTEETDGYLPEHVVSESFFSLRWASQKKNGDTSHIRTLGPWIREPHSINRKQACSYTDIFDASRVHTTIKRLLDGNLMVANECFSPCFQRKQHNMRSEEVYEILMKGLRAAEEVESDADAWKVGTYNHVVRAGDHFVLRRSKAPIRYKKCHGNSYEYEKHKFSPNCAVDADATSVPSGLIELDSLRELLRRTPVDGKPGDKNSTSACILHAQSAVADIVTHGILANAGVCPPLLAAGILENNTGETMGDLSYGAAHPHDDLVSLGRGERASCMRCPFPCCQIKQPSFVPIFHSVQLMPMVGRTLNVVLNYKQMSNSIDVVLSIWTEVMAMVGLIADAGFVHFDLHTQNILVEDDSTSNPYLPTRLPGRVFRAWAIDMSSADVLCMPTVARDARVALMEMTVARHFLHFTNAWTLHSKGGAAWTDAPWLAVFKRMLVDHVETEVPCKVCEKSELDMKGLHSLLAVQWPFLKKGLCRRENDQLQCVVHSFAGHHLIRRAKSPIAGVRSDMEQMWDYSSKDLELFNSSLSGDASDDWKEYTEAVVDLFRRSPAMQSTTNFEDSPLSKAGPLFDMVLRRYIIRAQCAMGTFSGRDTTKSLLRAAEPCVLQFAAALAINSAANSWVSTIDVAGDAQKHKRPCIDQNR
jgi:hypothetical protein